MLFLFRSSPHRDLQDAVTRQPQRVATMRFWKGWVRGRKGTKFRWTPRRRGCRQRPPRPLASAEPALPRHRAPPAPAVAASPSAILPPRWRHAGSPHPGRLVSSCAPLCVKQTPYFPSPATPDADCVGKHLVRAFEVCGMRDVRAVRPRLRACESVSGAYPHVNHGAQTEGPDNMQWSLHLEPKPPALCRELCRSPGPAGQEPPCEPWAMRT